MSYLFLLPAIIIWLYFTLPWMEMAFGFLPIKASVWRLMRRWVNTAAGLFCTLFFFAHTAFTQTTTLEGTVIDKLSKEPLVGASVSIKGGFDGATTNAEGHFRFNTEEKGKQTLIATYLGYKSWETGIDLASPSLRSLRIILEEQPADIREVVISAGAFEASDEKKGVVLQPLDIVTIPGANGDITGALNTLPGTTVNGETGQLVVRGGAPYETRVYVDGLSVNNYYTSAMPDVPARSRFSPFQFKGTTFASGGYSAEYGQALSSTLILNTPDMPAAAGKSLGISSVGLNATLTTLSEKTAWSASVGYINLRPYMALIKQNLDFLTPPENGSAAVEGRIKVKHDGMVKLGAQGSLGHSRIGYPQAPFESEAFSIGIVNRSARAFATWRQPVSAKWTLYSATQAEANQDDYSPNAYPAFKVKNQAGSARFSASYTPNNTWRWRNGVEAFYVHLNNPGLSGAPLDHALSAAYSEVETYAGDRIVLRGGLRGEHDFLLAKSNVAPRISAAYKIRRSAQLSASWGIFYQAPEDTLLLRTAALGFERAQHFILNYQFERDKRIFRIETYYKKYDDLVRTDMAYANNGKGYAQGIELFFRDRKTFKWGDYWISYSFLDTKRQYRWYPEQAMPTFAAKHNASFVYKYFFSKPQISANLSYTIQSGRPYYNPDNPEFLGDRTPTYHNLSLQVAKLTSLFGNFTVLVASVTNVLGSKQVYTYRFTPVPGTNPLEYYRQEIIPPAPRFLFVGCFINFGDKRKKVSKEEGLE